MPGPQTQVWVHPCLGNEPVSGRKHARIWIERCSGTKEVVLPEVGACLKALSGDDEECPEASWLPSSHPEQTSFDEYGRYAHFFARPRSPPSSQAKATVQGNQRPGTAGQRRSLGKHAKCRSEIGHQ